MRIRTKLAVTVAIPLAALVGFSSVVVASSAADADEAATRATEIREQVALATASLGPGGVIATLSDERSKEAIGLLGLSIDLGGGSGTTPEEVRAANDRALEQFRTTLATKPASVRRIYQPALDALDEVATIRTAAQGYAGPRVPTNTFASEIFTRYSDVIERVFDANSRATLAIDHAGLRTEAELIDLTSRTKETEAQTIRELLLDYAVTGAGGLDPQALPKVADLQARARFFDEQLRSKAAADHADAIDDALANADLRRFRAVGTSAVNGGDIDPAPLLSATGVGLQAFDDLSAVIAKRLEDDARSLVTGAEQAEADARSRQNLMLAGAAVVLLLAGAVALLTARSIRRPMQRLAREAEEMAARRLPAAVQKILDTPLGDDVVMDELPTIPAGGGREIAEVAQALDTVQASAAELAVEQALLRRNIADSFVNLGRRNQNLLGRQLDAITEMERTESDPEGLRKLFALDHLATRMRRNAESLLLLAGEEPHRQWSAPVAIIDVLRGALGEVEDYERVRIDDLDAATIEGRAVADLSHLVAELLENALHYSPPGRDVEVIGQRVGGGYRLAIVDHGVGMDAEQLAEANRRLAGAESFTVAPSRYLGHYVVGTQAARLGVSVSLHETATGGVTARIELGDVLAEEHTDEPVVAPVVETAFTAPAPEAAPTPAPEPEAASPAPTPAPATERESDEVLVATEATVEQSAPTGTDGGVTASGYKRRVRGAQNVRTDVLAARRADDSDNQPVAASPAEGMRSLLSGLQAGTERGLAEARGTDDTDTPQEDQR